MSESSRVLYLLGPEHVELRDRPLPEPGPGEVLLRVDAATTCGTDLKVFLHGGHPRMLEVPTPFGHEVAGTVVAVGRTVVTLGEGDRVVVANSASCGECEACREHRENLCSDLHYLNGAFADHLVLPARFVARSTYRVPAGLDPALAAMAEPLACVHHGVAACGSVAGVQAVVLGAGPIGLMFVRELATAGAEITLADGVIPRLEVGARMGAETTVRLALDETDPERVRATIGGGRGAALVVEATGSPLGWSTALASVRMGGTVVLFGGCPPGTVVPCDSHRIHYSELTVRGVYHHRPATFASALARLAAAPDEFVLLLSEERPLREVEAALRGMAERRILKAAIRPTLG
jgi:L-iditol 2-dehydrogenase